MGNWRPATTKRYHSYHKEDVTGSLVEEINMDAGLGEGSIKRKPWEADNYETSNPNRSLTLKVENKLSGGLSL